MRGVIKNIIRTLFSVQVMTIFMMLFFGWLGSKMELPVGIIDWWWYVNITTCVSSLILLLILNKVKD